MDTRSIIDDIIERDHNTKTPENLEELNEIMKTYSGPFSEEQLQRIVGMKGDVNDIFLNIIRMYLVHLRGRPLDAPVEKFSIKDPVEALRILQINTNNAYYIDPSIFTEEMIHLILAGPEKNRGYLNPKLNPDLYRRMMPVFLQYPNICEQVDVTPFLTDEQIIGLGYKQDPSTFYQQLREALFSSARLYGDRHICIHALCHGRLLTEISPDVQVTRYSSVPLGACEYNTKTHLIRMHNETKFETFEASTVDTILKLRERELGEGDERAKRAEAIRLVREIKKVYLPPSSDPEVAIEEEEEQIMDKVFTTDGERVVFLDIVTRTGTFNLFSLGDTWTLGHIIDMLTGLLGGNYFSIVMGDYSCSEHETRGPAELVHAGKRKHKRTRNRTRRKRTRKR